MSPLESQHRQGPDRRVSTAPFWSPRRLHGRRGKMRRASEHDRPYLVDRAPWSFVACACLLLILTLADGLLTLALLDRGYEEANPLMARLLDHGPMTFLAGKYVMTALILPIALVMNHYRVFRTRLRVGRMLAAGVALYVILVSYQLLLLNS